MAPHQHQRIIDLKLEPQTELVVRAIASRLQSHAYEGCSSKESIQSWSARTGLARDLLDQMLHDAGALARLSNAEARESQALAHAVEFPIAGGLADGRLLPVY